MRISIKNYPSRALRYTFRKLTSFDRVKRSNEATGEHSTVRCSGATTSFQLLPAKRRVVRENRWPVTLYQRRRERGWNEAREEARVAKAIR